MKIPKPTYIFLAFMLVVTACNLLQPQATATDIPTLAPSRTPEPIETPEPNATPTKTPRPTVQTGSAISEDMVIAFTLIDFEGIEIYLTDPKGEEIIQITDHQQVAYQSMWSPDGSMLTYLVQDFESGDLSLWLIDFEVGEEGVEIKNDFLNSPSHFSWSSDNKHIVFSDVQPDGFEMDVYRVDVESGETVNLTESSGHWDFSPNSSPKGDRIAFVSDRPTDQENFDDIWVMDLGGSSLVNLTDNGTDWEDKFPSWSPDGEKIVYYHWTFFPPEDAEPAGLWVMDKDGSNAYLAADVEISFIREPAVWSPDGAYIAFLTGIDYEASDLWIVPSDGSAEPTQVTDLPGSVFNVSWSPDGENLIFNHIVEEGESSSWTIYILSVDGNEMRKLLEDVEITDPAWRP